MYRCGPMSVPVGAECVVVGLCLCTGGDRVRRCVFCVSMGTGCTVMNLYLCSGRVGCAVGNQVLRCTFCVYRQEPEESGGSR